MISGNLCGKMDEEVLEEYRVEEAWESANKGRGEPLEWRIVNKKKTYQLGQCCEDGWAGIFSWF